MNRPSLHADEVTRDDVRFLAALCIVILGMPGAFISLLIGGVWWLS